MLIENDVYYFGLKDKERRLFDQLVPLPEGTTYNSYLVKGSEKVALIDTMYPKKADEYIKMLENSGVEKIDYVIANHGEQDHSGALPKILMKYPDAVVLTNEKCKNIMIDMLNLPQEKFQIVSDREEINLGGKTLQFIYAPWVHWPDTMFTYLKEDNMLFTCDYLGAHYTSSELFSDDSENLKVAAKRYYAEIIMPFRTFAAKYLKMIKEMHVKMILPSHGPIYKNPDFIYNLYESWTSEKVDNLVLIPYVSMYESTKKMAEYVETKLDELNIKAVLFDTVSEDHGELAMHLVNTATIVLAAPMVLAGPHPSMVMTSYLLSILRPKFKNLAIIGSYGWGGNLAAKLEDMFASLKPNKIDSVIIKGYPKAEDFKKLDELCLQIVAKHKEQGLL